MDALARANREEAAHLAEQTRVLEEKRQEWQDELEVGGAVAGCCSTLLVIAAEQHMMLRFGAC